MPTSTAEMMVPSRRPTMVCRTARLSSTAASTMEESTKTLMLPKFLCVRKTMATTMPSPGSTVALLMISKLTPRPSTMDPTRHMSICCQ